MNYIGSKLSLLPFLDESIGNIVKEDVTKLTFCDLFAGTGIVGRYFKRKGCRIIANDLQYYSYVLNRNYIGNNKKLSFERLNISQCNSTPFNCSKQEEICSYLEHIDIVRGFIYNTYCKDDKNEDEQYRLYYSNLNGGRCDAIRQQIEKWKNNVQITDDEYYFLLATLIEAIDKVANTASVYGAYLKKLKSSAQKHLQMKPATFDTNSHNNEVYNEDASKLIKNIYADVLYLDPPYNQRQYSANYHLLETIAKYDNPIVFGKTGMRDYTNQKSKYCKKNEVRDTFEDLIMNANAKYIFLSYNNEGLMNFDDIRKIMSKRGKYFRFEKEYNRFQADNASGTRHIKADKTIEYLHCVKIKD